MFISDKTDFKMKTFTGDKDTTQWSRDQSKKPKLTIYVSTIGVPLYREQRLITINGEIYNNTINSWGFNIPLTPTDISSRQKINKETQALNDTLGQTDLIDTYRALHPKAAEYTLFSTAYGIFSRIDHMLGHKVSLGKFS